MTIDEFKAALTRGDYSDEERKEITEAAVKLMIGCGIISEVAREHTALGLGSAAGIVLAIADAEGLDANEVVNVVREGIATAKAANPKLADFTYNTEA